MQWNFSIKQESPRGDAGPGWSQFFICWGISEEGWGPGLHYQGSAQHSRVTCPHKPGGGETAGGCMARAEISDDNR
jgi:hypothetical protein